MMRSQNPYEMTPMMMSGSPGVGVTARGWAFESTFPAGLCFRHVLQCDQCASDLRFALNQVGVCFASEGNTR